MGPTVTKRPEGRRPCHAVRAEAREPLEAPQRRLRVGAEVSIQRARGEAVPGELELQSRNAPATGAVVQHAARVVVPPVAAERPPRLRAGDSVYGDPGARSEERRGGKECRS